MNFEDSKQVTGLPTSYVPVGAYVHYRNGVLYRLSGYRTFRVADPDPSLVDLDPDPVGRNFLAWSDSDL